MKARRNSNAEEAIDVVSVDVSVEYGSETEQTEGGRPVRKRKAIVPFDEDTDMDTDDLLEQEVVKTKKKPTPRVKAKQTLNEDGTVKAPRKYTRRKSSAFSDDDDSIGKCGSTRGNEEDVADFDVYINQL